MLGSAWGFVVVEMLATLLVVFILRLRRSGGDGSGRMIALGVGIGLLVAGVALVASLSEQG